MIQYGEKRPEGQVFIAWCDACDENEIELYEDICESESDFMELLTAWGWTVKRGIFWEISWEHYCGRCSKMGINNLVRRDDID